MYLNQSTEEDYYVVLRTGEDEQIVTRAELEALLAQVVASTEHLEGTALALQIKYLIDTACEYPTQPGEYWQWYSIRLEKPR